MQEVKSIIIDIGLFTIPVNGEWLFNYQVP